MRFSDILGMSAGSLWRRKMRTLLTVLGVLIGTTSVVVMISLGIGLKESLMESWNQSGTANDITVNYSESTKSITSDKYITDAKVEELKRLDFVADIEPVFVSGVTITQGRWAINATVLGISSEEIEKLEIGTGQTISTDTNNLEFIAGEHLIEQAYDMRTWKFPYYDEGEYADMDYFNQTVYTTFNAETEYAQSEESIAAKRKFIIPIVGVTSGDEMGMRVESYCLVADREALIQYMKKQYRGELIPGQPTDKNGKPLKEIVYLQLRVRTHSTDEVEAATKYFQDMGYDVQSNLSIMAEIDNTFKIVQVVLGGIGAVALLVAAIGIANTMTMSTYERTKEIGVMKVLGCSLSNIRAMFLTEAAFIGFIGGVVGTAFSIVLSKLVNVFAVPMLQGAQMDIGNIEISRVPLWLMLLAIIFATLVGMIAGFFPAQRATKLSALAAIRNN